MAPGYVCCAPLPSSSLLVGGLVFLWLIPEERAVPAGLLLHCVEPSCDAWSFRPARYHLLQFPLWCLYFLLTDLREVFVYQIY